MRVRAGLARSRRNRRLRKLARGAWGARSKRIRAIKENLARAMRYSFENRRARKREFRKLWIERINAAARQRGLTYSEFLCGLTRAGAAVDRNMLAELAVSDAGAFDRLVEVARGALNANR